MSQTYAVHISDVNEVTKQLDSVLNMEISSKEDLVIMIQRQSHVLQEIEEQLLQHYIAFQQNTNDETAKKVYEFDQKHIHPLVKRYKGLFEQKYYESPFRLQLDQDYEFLNKRIQNANELFHEQNIELEVTEDELITKYFTITGNLTVMWDEAEIPFMELRAYFQDKDRNVRQRAMTLLFEALQSAEGELQQLLHELIAIRSKKAKNVKLANYREYMFKKYERFDYTEKDCHTFAQSIRDYVIPLEEKFQEELRQSIYVNTLRPWDTRAIPNNQKPLKPIEHEYELIEKSKIILEKLDDSFAALLQKMQDQGNLDLKSRVGKAPGGFCEYLPFSKQSFIFMTLTNTQDDVVIFLHEMGHALHNELMKDITVKQYQQLPMETAELASMTMELFSMEHWDVFYDDKEQLKQAKQEQLKQIVSFLPFTLLIDQFQHWLYENPVHSAKERNDKFLELAKRYDSNVVNWEGYESWQTAQWLHVLHIFEVPFYYIEYAIAQIGALQLYKQYKENPKKTLENYKKALSLGSSKSVKEVYETAGITFDFSSETIKDVLRFVEKELALLDQ
ncbi:M3 family oligoendopeptidase [Bacillus manliponensis]|uniref:M3 family oligoendopeptidase n=1 Tax=Bacillus manliponensis TaxID=574376 RepID=UPI00351722C0